MKVLSYLIFYFLTCCFVFSQETIRLRTLSTNDGLSQNSVNQVLQDEDSYMWIATQDGLNKYDGYDFEIFRPDLEDSFSVSDNFIIQMIEDDLGRLWLSTREGINVFDKQTRRFHKLRDKTASIPQVWSLQQHDEWMYWARSDGKNYTLVRINHELPLTNAISEIETLIETLFKTQDSFKQFVINKTGLWLITENYITKFNSSDTINLKDPFSVPIVDKSMLIGDSIIIIPHEGGIIGIHTDSMRQILNIRSNATFSMCSKSLHEVLVGTSKGVFMLDPSTFHYRSINTSPVDLKTTLIHNIYKDHSGLFWISTANQGLMIYNPRWDQFQYSKTNNNIVWFATDSEDEYILGTQNGLIIRSKNESSNQSESLSDHSFTSVYIDDERTTWAGTSNGLVYKKSYFGTSFVLFDYQSPNKNAITNFHQDGIGNMWIGSHSDVSVISTEGKVTSMQKKTGNDFYVLDMFEDSQNNLWVGSFNGVGYFTPEFSFRLLPYIKNAPKSINFNFASSVQEDSQGTIWISTYGGGISRLNTDSTFTHFTTRDGLSNNVIHDMLIDDHDRLWMVSNGGLSVFDIHTTSFVNLNKSNGLLSHNFALGGGNKLSDGQLSFGTVEGLLHFSPDSISWNEKSPQIHFEKLLINYKEAENQSIDTAHNLNLYAQDKVFSMKIVSPNFIDPQNLIYEYKLEGFDDEWVVADQPDLRITYSSLPYDNFVLRVKNASRNNQFSGSERTLLIKVHPPFWLAWWFIVMIVISFGGMISAMIYYLSRRKLKIRLAELETKAKIQHERERISRDLHDSVGTHFAYIISRLDFLYLSWGKKEIVDTKDYLGKVTEFARSGMKMLRETIWALNEEQVEAKSLKLKIDDYLRLCFSGLRQQFEFSYLSSSDKVNSAIALNTFRIIQEGVSNALKHSQGHSISIIVSLKEDQLTLKISDDGIGFDQEKAISMDDHYGLQNIKRRAEEINSTLNIHTSENGTQLIIQSKNNP